MSNDYITGQDTEAFERYYMSVLSDLFSSIKAFQQYVPYLEANTSFDDLNASALPASKQIKIIITPSIYTSIQNLVEGNGSAKKEALRGALSNLTMSATILII